MRKTLLLTGATDGIGFEAAKQFAAQGHTLLLHGRNDTKLAHVQATLSEQFSGAAIDTFKADLSNPTDVVLLINDIKSRYTSLDVLINNAGVFKVPSPTTDKGYDVRFMVNTIAPYLLTKRLLPLLSNNSRVINVSSAAQAPVSLQALQGFEALSDSDAYAQSKLAITMWTVALAKSLNAEASEQDTVKNSVPSLIAVNPASFLGSKMVKEAYGSEGKDLNIGANILRRVALDEAFEKVTGRYYDNDIGAWSQPYPDALNDEKNNAVIDVIEVILKKFGIQSSLPPYL